MTTSMKSLMLLAFTLIVGFSLGLFADATLVRGRRDRIAGMRRPAGFVAHFEEVIHPHSGAQGDSIRPILEAMGRGNDSVVRTANLALRARMDSLRTRLSPMLDSDQQKRLSDELNRLPAFGMGRGGPGRGGPGRRGGPPDGGFGPPGERPPPP